MELTDEMKNDPVIADMRRPKMVEVRTMDGEPMQFVISRFDAVTGREIITQYPFSILSNLGISVSLSEQKGADLTGFKHAEALAAHYRRNMGIVEKMMTHVAVKTANGFMRLENEGVIIGNVPDAETLLKLEWQVLNYNTSIVRNGKAINFFDLIKAKAMIFAKEAIATFNKKKG